jgi:hypothetical protein
MSIATVSELKTFSFVSAPISSIWMWFRLRLNSIGQGLGPIEVGAIATSLYYFIKMMRLLAISAPLMVICVKDNFEPSHFLRLMN